MMLSKWSMLLLWALVTWASTTSAQREINFPSSETNTDQAPCSTLNKVHLDQNDTTIYGPCVHMLEFMTVVPDLIGFTSDFWINLDTIDMNATVFTYIADECRDHWPGICIDTVDAGACSCSEAHGIGWCQGNDFVTNNCQRTCGLCREDNGGKSTLITFKFVPPRSWELTIMGMQILMAVGPSIKAGSWHHILVSWHREAPATVWMDAQLIYQQQNVEHGRRLVIPGGGMVKVGQTEEALGYPGAFVCEDMGEGLRGWITLFNLDSRAIKIPDDTSSKEKINRLYSQCTAISKGHDIVEWITTVRKGFGGIATHLAEEKCHHF